MNPIFTGRIEQGKVIYNNPTRYLAQVHSLEGKRIECVLRQEKSKRSNQQNNYYFGVVCKVLGDYFGYDTEEMHDALKYKFLRKGAADLETVQSTTKMNTAEFEEYLEKIRRWAATDYGVVVPLPNEAEP
jgi:hypothetical protein